MILDSEEKPKPAMQGIAGQGRASKSGNGNGHGNGHPVGKSDPHLAEPVDLIGTLSTTEKQTLLRGMMKAILDEGIIIQDVRRGLIDFPAWKGSKEVLLCYELNDGEAIQFWHEVNAGFAGRRELADWGES